MWVSLGSGGTMAAYKYINTNTQIQSAQKTTVLKRQRYKRRRRDPNPTTTNPNLKTTNPNLKTTDQDKCMVMNMIHIYGDDAL